MPPASRVTRSTGSLRLFSLFGPGHTVLLYAGEDAGPADVERFERAATAAATAAHGRLNAYLIAAPRADIATTVLPLIRDGGSDFARAYAAGGDSVFVVRPDGYLGFTGPDGDIDGLVAHLRATFG